MVWQRNGIFAFAALFAVASRVTGGALDSVGVTKTFGWWIVSIESASERKNRKRRLCCCSSCSAWALAACNGNFFFARSCAPAGRCWVLFACRTLDAGCRSCFLPEVKAERRTPRSSSWPKLLAQLCPLWFWAVWVGSDRSAWRSPLMLVLPLRSLVTRSNRASATTGFFWWATAPLGNFPLSLWPHPKPTPGLGLCVALAGPARRSGSVGPTARRAHISPSSDDTRPRCSAVKWATGVNRHPLVGRLPLIARPGSDLGNNCCTSTAYIIHPA